MSKTALIAMVVAALAAPAHALSDAEARQHFAYLAEHIWTCDGFVETGENITTNLFAFEVRDGSRLRGQSFTKMVFGGREYTASGLFEGNSYTSSGRAHFRSTSFFLSESDPLPGGRSWATTATFEFTLERTPNSASLYTLTGKSSGANAFTQTYACQPTPRP